MEKIKVSAVSYSNTKPFVYGLKNYGGFIEKFMELSLDMPADCYDKLNSSQADIGLVPVALLSENKNLRIISDYCIGSENEVNSVFILSKKPVNDIKVLLLDNESRTSNGLARILVKFHWKKDILFTKDPAHLDIDGRILIGDRTFGIKKDYPYAYDLGFYWREMTSLPFAYALWMANKEIDKDFIEEFNKALKFGLDNRKELLKNITSQSGFDIEDYLMNKISFTLDKDKLKAVDLYIKLLGELNEIDVTFAEKLRTEKSV